MRSLGGRASRGSISTWSLWVVKSAFRWRHVCVCLMFAAAVARTRWKEQLVARGRVILLGSISAAQLRWLYLAEICLGCLSGSYTGRVSRSYVAEQYVFLASESSMVSTSRPSTVKQRREPFGLRSSQGQGILKGQSRRKQADKSPL